VLDQVIKPLFVETNPKLRPGGVMSLKPLAQIRLGFEEFRFQGMQLTNRQSAKPAKVKKSTHYWDRGRPRPHVAQEQSDKKQFYFVHP